MSFYQPQPYLGPAEPSSVAQWAQTEFQRLARALFEAGDYVVFKVLHAEPVKVRGGMVAYADGTNWNPGSGAGLYRRSEDNTAWSFVG